MQIIQLQPRENGSRPPIQTWSEPVPPPGYAQVDCPTDVFADSLGFVNLDIEDGIVKGMSPNTEAKAAYLATLPPEADDQSPQTDIDKMAAAYMEGVQTA